MSYSSNSRDLPGPNDPECWPPYAGHPNDPRGPVEIEPTDEELAIELIAQCADFARAENLVNGWEVLNGTESLLLCAAAICQSQAPKSKGAYDAFGRAVMSIIRADLERRAVQINDSESHLSARSF